MKCKNFGCTQQAVQPYPYCDSSCGFQFKKDRSLLLNYQDGITKWSDVLWSIKNWSIEKLEYLSKNI
jgi:hypothetical protein